MVLLVEELRYGSWRAVQRCSGSAILPSYPVQQVRDLGSLSCRDVSREGTSLSQTHKDMSFGDTSHRAHSPKVHCVVHEATASVHVCIYILLYYVSCTVICHV